MSHFDLDRSNALSDGVFAIAITLLVLSIHVPDGYDHDLWNGLRETLPQIVGYVIAFGTVAVLWINHHRFFADLQQVDGRLMALNLAYLGVVAFLPFPAGLLGDFGDQSAPVVLFALSVAVAVTFAGLMRTHAERAGLFSPQARRLTRLQSALVPAFFLGSVVIAIFSPRAATYSWLALPLISRWVDRRAIAAGA